VNYFSGVQRVLWEKDLNLIVRSMNKLGVCKCSDLAVELGMGEQWVRARIELMKVKGMVVCESRGRAINWRLV
jgi:DNA-binding transcriptional regulator PaaX